MLLTELADTHVVAMHSVTPIAVPTLRFQLGVPASTVTLVDPDVGMFDDKTPLMLPPKEIVPS